MKEEEGGGVNILICAVYVLTLLYRSVTMESGVAGARSSISRAARLSRAGVGEEKTPVRELARAKKEMKEVFMVICFWVVSEDLGLDVKVNGVLMF